MSPLQRGDLLYHVTGRMRGSLLTTQTMVTMGIIPYQGKNPHGRAGNRTRDLIINSQKRWPLDHEAGHVMITVQKTRKQFITVSITFGMRTVLHWTRSARTQFVMSINVWRLAGDSLNITVTLCIVIIRCTETFWSLCSCSGSLENELSVLIDTGEENEDVTYLHETNLVKIV
jgi:hypothetical protein